MTGIIIFLAGLVLGFIIAWMVKDLVAAEGGSRYEYGSAEPQYAYASELAGTSGEGGARPASPPPAPAAEPAPPAPAAAPAPPLAPKPAAGPDDLKAIKGVGPRLEGLLHELGVTTYQQIADFTPARIAEVNDKLNFSGRIERDDWVGQAKRLHAEKHDA